MSRDLRRGAAGSESAPPWAPAPSAAAAAANAPAEGDALRRRMRETIVQGLHGLCFSPYAPGQAPGMQVPEQAIAQRLRLIAPYTQWVRSFACTEGHDATPRLARQAGLKTLVGAWLGTDRDANRRELDALIAVGRAGLADIVAVGNEVLLRGDLTEDELLACIADVRHALPDVTLGYVDAYYLFEQHPRVARACDVVLANCYPFWEGCPRAQAVDYMRDMYRRACVAAEGRPVVIAETGWPDRGAAVGAAVPSAHDAMRYFLDAQAWARSDGVAMFHFAAFDEAWKIDAEGDVGGCWGLWDENGNAKYV